jgi:hypothetical protein
VEREKEREPMGMERMMRMIEEKEMMMESDQYC